MQVRKIDFRRRGNRLILPASDEIIDDVLLGPLFSSNGLERCWTNRSGSETLLLTFICLLELLISQNPNCLRVCDGSLPDEFPRCLDVRLSRAFGPLGNSLRPAARTDTRSGDSHYRVG
jgi:hypothetical protein